MNEQLLVREKVDNTLNEWREKEKIALELLQIVGELRFDHNIELVLFRRDIYDSRPSQVINDHKIAANYSKTPISIDTSLQLARAISKVENLAPCRMDLGKLGMQWNEEKAAYEEDMTRFINDKMASMEGVAGEGSTPRDVVLYGFGRIGRLLARRILETTGKGDQLRLKAIVLRPKMGGGYEEGVKRASLLQTDSIHGDFHGAVEVTEDGSELIVNGNRIRLIYAAKPEDVDYTKYGIQHALVIDNTGVWRDNEALRVHLRPGVDKVMLTAPGKGIPNIVYGINQGEYDFEKENVFCAASCTTNAISPVLQVLNDQLGIERGHVETIHAYTSDQNLLDNFHKKPRRGRGAAVNMVLTSTGAAKAVAKVIPALEGKLTGNAVRVPTPDVSLAILSLTVKTATDRAALNQLLKNASLYGDLVEQIRYSESEEYVSSDAIGMTGTSVVDAPSTIVSEDGKNLTIYLWYDNEYGYSCQVVRLAKYAMQVRRRIYY